ncbi:MAG: asparagine synthase (glutamine-hydrolyzing) [Thermoanaerobaculia bacterium]
MCGIAGLAARPHQTDRINRAQALNVLACIGHRGPDAQADYTDGQVWLGHARLSILDLSEAGSQPMSSADGRFTIVYNGEVYNFRDLAGELAIEGLRSSSDTEVILRMFERLAERTFVRLNGIFAFALYDRQEQTLWLVRDRLGVKPLYFRFDDQGLSFGSEIKALRILAGEALDCDPAALHEWLYYGNALGGRTLFAGVQQLLPGHFLKLDLRTFELDVRSYWSLHEQASTRNRIKAPASELIAETRRLLEAAVKRQLVSDVPVGVFLSGGVDSSAITAFASRHYGGRLATYSVGFDDLQGTDERPKARLVAEHFGTDHHELHIGGSGLPDLVEKMVRHHDLPFCDAANLPLYLMAEKISGSTKVVLQGDGGDEVFGGYRRYASLRLRPLLKGLSGPGEVVAGLLPDSVNTRRIRRYVHAYAAPDVATTMALLLTPVSPLEQPEAIFAPEFRRLIEANDPFARYRACQPLFAGHDIGNQMSLVDMSIELPDIFLEKVDRSTMAASLEVRVPFLDHDLIDYVVRIPGHRKMPQGRKKWLLKQALAGIVPHEILYGPKTGFNVPFGYWLRTHLRQLFFDHLGAFEGRDPGVLDRDRIEWMYTAMCRGEFDRSNTLWNLLNLMVWCNQGKVRLGTGHMGEVAVAAPGAAAQVPIAGVDKKAVRPRDEPAAG